MQLIPDRNYVSHPNISPLSGPAVARIGAALEPFSFDVIYDAFFDRVIPRGGKGRGASVGQALRRHHRRRRHGGAGLIKVRLRPRRRCETGSAGPFR